MFANDSHLPQVLPPESYCSDQHFQLEVDRLFRPAWHCVGSLGSLPEDGSFLTLDLFGTPVLVRRDGDEVSAFLNVCAHRFCKLTSQDCGKAKTLRCQYHGWEYDNEGWTRKIPDAKSFKPLEKGVLGLNRFRTQICGQLVFVALEENSSSLEEFLGPLYGVVEEFFSDRMQYGGRRDDPSDANWKIVTENTVESYHVQEVHPKTFGVMPEESECEHAFETKASFFRHKPPMPARTIGQRMQQGFWHWMGMQPETEYNHWHGYPNFMMGRMGIFTWYETILPISPTKTRVRAETFIQAPRKGWLQKFVVNRIRNGAEKFFRTVVAEDAAVMPEIQAGVSAGEYPSPGLISTREERIFHFQEFVHKAIYSDSPERRDSTEDGPAIRESSSEVASSNANSTYIPPATLPSLPTADQTGSRASG